MRRKSDSPGPKATVYKGFDQDFASLVEVDLSAGDTIYTRELPLWFTEGVTSTRAELGWRWDSTAAGQIRVGVKTGAAVLDINLADESYAIDPGLLVMWTGELQLESPGWADAVGLTAVVGAERLWLAAPGYTVLWPSRSGGPRANPPVVVDPALVVWLKRGQDTPGTLAGPDGRVWLRLDGTHEAMLHSWSSPGAMS